MIEKIIYKTKVYAIILRANFYKKGINFFTKDKDSFQLGYINYKKNHEIKAHYHPRHKKVINRTSEVLVVKKGKIRVDFFSNDKKQKYIESKILKERDTILILNGCHGFKVLKEVEMIEIKQGPYELKKDKIHIKSNIKK